LPKTKSLFWAYKKGRKAKAAVVTTRPKSVDSW
jgi:hypothetical protein